MLFTLKINISNIFFPIHYCRKVYIYCLLCFKYTADYTVKNICNLSIALTAGVVTIKRKIIKQGHNTLTITLPKKWSNKHQIKSGDELDVEEQGEILMIVPHKNVKLPEIILDVKGLAPVVIWRYISAVYRAGYDEFRIYFDNVKEKKRYSAFSYNTLDLLYSQNHQEKPVLSPIEVIQSAVNRCIGVEIIDQKENWCLVKELGETTYKEFDNALRRIFLLLLSLSEETLNSVKAGSVKDSLKSVHLIDTNIDRFTDFCFRVLNKKGYQDFRKTPTIYSILLLLEMIGDEFKKISIHLIEAKKITNKTEGLLNIQHRQLRRFYHLFYRFSKEKCSEIYEEDSKGHTYNSDLFESLSTDEKEILHHLKKIGIYLTSLTELRIDLEY